MGRARDETKIACRKHRKITEEEGGEVRKGGKEPYELYNEIDMPLKKKLMLAYSVTRGPR